MNIDALILALPVLFFILATLVGLLRRQSSRWHYLPAVLGCHIAVAVLLWMGGVFKPAARVDLLALEAELEDRSGQSTRLTVGGASGRDGGPADSFYVPDYPAAAFEFRRDKQGAWHLQPGIGWRPELIVWSGGKPVTMKESLPALVPLSSGDQLRLKPAEEKPPLELTYEEKQPWKHAALLHAGDRSWTLPNRQIEIPVLGSQVSLLRRHLLRQRVYPLRESGFTPSLHSVILNGLDHPEALGAHLLLLDEGLKVIRQGVETPLVWQALEPGADLRFDELLPEQNGRPPRMITHRSFRALEFISRLGDRPARVRLELEKAQVQSIPMSRISEVNSGAVPRLLLHDRFQSRADTPAVLFNHLTRRHDPANAELRLEKSGWIIRDDHGDRPFEWGRSFWLGRDHLLELHLQHAGVPWRLIGLTLLGGLLGAAAFMAMPQRGFMGGLFFGLTFLAGMRLLDARAAWVNAPHDAGVVAVAAQVIWMLPLLLSALWLGLPLLSKHLQSWLAEARRGWTYPSLITLALTLLGLRLVLGLIGFKEALALPGARLALSMFFVPAHLMLFALALCRLEADRAREPLNPLAPQWRFLGFIYAIFFPAQLVAGVFVSDLGTFLYFLPPTVVLTAQGLGIAVAEVRSLWQKTGGESESRGMALISALLFLLPAAGLTAVVANPLDAVSVFPEVRTALSTPDKVITESNVLRLMQFIDDDSLAAMGTDEAERISQDHALMRSYSQRGVLGDGFLGVNVVHAKRETALNDNVFAVYGLAQFGLVGGLLLITAYVALMLGGCGGGSCLFGRHLALLSALALGLTSLYMMGANTGLLPFTGRNMYLLGLNSLGDVAETAVLVTLILAGLGWRQEAAETAPLG